MPDRQLHCPNCGSIFDLTEDGWDGASVNNQKLECQICHHPLAILVLQPEVVEHTAKDCNYCAYLTNPFQRSAVGVYEPSKIYKNEPEESEV